MADFHHHFLGGYRYCSSIKPRLHIDLGTKKGSRLQRVKFNFGSISMIVQKEPKMNLELAFSHILLIIVSIINYYNINIIIR